MVGLLPTDGCQDDCNVPETQTRSTHKCIYTWAISGDSKYVVDPKRKRCGETRNPPSGRHDLHTSLVPENLGPKLWKLYALPQDSAPN